MQNAEKLNVNISETLTFDLYLLKPSAKRNYKFKWLLFLLLINHVVLQKLFTWSVLAR